MVLKFHSAARSALTFFVLCLIIVTSFGAVFPNTFASPDTTIAVTPETNVANVGELFTITVTIANVPDTISDVSGYQVKIGIDKNVLEPVSVTEGTFLSDWAAFWSTTTFFTFKFDDPDYVYVADVIVGLYPGASGYDGPLFDATFRVKAPGTSGLDMFGSIINSCDGVSPPVAHYPPEFVEQDGTFYTPAPVASFSFSPKSYGRPIVGENVTFDASASFDPDGGAIVDYAWNFDDGTFGSGIIVKHIYQQPSSPTRPYNVTLTVTDDEGMNTTTWKKSISDRLEVKRHDISITKITAPEEIFLHEIAYFNVTVKNNGSHPDTFNTTAYYNSQPIGRVYFEGLPVGVSENITFAWNTFINQTTTIPSSLGSGTWTVDAFNASVSDDIYTFSSTNQSTQDFKHYTFDATGWNQTFTAGISKFEVGLEVRTDTGGDDQLSIRVWTGKAWTTEYIFDVTSAIDTFFWTDVTENLTWLPNMIDRGDMYVRIKYIQVGAEATPIYVDWLPVRITPKHPVDVPEGTHFLWASAFLVEPVAPHAFRPNEEKNLTDNTLFGDPIAVTVVPVHNVAVIGLKVSPTELIFGGSAKIQVVIKNLGNKEEIIDILVYANSTLVGSLNDVRMLVGATQSYPFAWYQADNSAVEGYYNVTVYIPPVADESDSTDNVLNSTVLMRLLPVASFSFSPASPVMGEEITFTASASYAPGVPGGTITEYRWNFGDGSTGTGATIQHTFASPGDKIVKLVVIDDVGLNSSLSRKVEVLKLTSSITMTVSLSKVPISLDTTISGAIAPVRASVPVYINYTLVTEAKWLELASVTTDASGQYSFVWSPTETGTYTLNATWLGDADTFGASFVLNVTVTIQDIAIFSVAPAEIRVLPGDSVGIKVTALNKGTATETFEVSVYYNDTLLETRSVNNLVSRANATLDFVLDTNGLAEGVYILKAVASALQGETFIVDNSRTSGITVLGQQEAGTSIFLYTTIGLAIAVVLLAVYMFRLRKPKP